MCLHGQYCVYATIESQHKPLTISPGLSSQTITFVYIQTLSQPRRLPLYTFNLSALLTTEES